MEIFNLSNKVCIITGASRGLGAAIARGLALAGADVVIVSRTLATLEEKAQEIRDIGRRVLPLVADIGNLSDTERIVAETLNVFEKIDVLVNNAGIAMLKRAEEITPADWENILRVNLTGTFFCSLAVGKAMIKQKSGNIINMASIGGVVGLPRQAAYCATKGGIIQLTKALALDWSHYNIRVNAIAPAYMETDLTEGMRESDIISKNLLSQTPLGRFGKSDEVVGAAIYLASDASSYVTGQTIFVDGGWLAK